MADIQTRDVPLKTAEVPRAALIISTALAMITISILAIFLAQRVRAIKNWQALQPANWLVFAIYIDSLLFVLLTAILSHGWGLNSSQGACSAAILLCLVCYMSTKVLIYYFLVEKVYIIRRVSKSRMQSKLHLFNCFGVLIPFLGVIILNFVFRINRFQDGTCIIGMERKVLLPLIIYDLAINVWLTALFIMPLRRLYTYKNNPKSGLRTLTIRTFFGSVVTLTSSIVNLSVLMALTGEPAWVCLMCCNSDILFNTIVIHWVTSNDPQSRIGSLPSSQTPAQSRGTNLSHHERVAPYTESGKPTILTNISAGVANDNESRDKVDLETGNPATMKLGTITVRTEYTREEVDGKWVDVNHIDPSQRRSSNGSERDLIHEST